MLKRNQFPEHLINKVIKVYLDRVINFITPCKDFDTPPDGTYHLYFKLQYFVFLILPNVTFTPLLNVIAKILT